MFGLPIAFLIPMEMKSKQMRIGTFCLSIFLAGGLPFTSWAANAITCSNVYSNSKSYPVQVTVQGEPRTFEHHFKAQDGQDKVVVIQADNRIQETHVQDVIGRFHNMAELMESAGVKIPAKTTILLDYENKTGFEATIFGEAPHYSAVGAITRIPIHFNAKSKVPRPMEEVIHLSQGVQIHELGHAFLDANMLDTSSWKNFVNAKVTARQLVSERSKIGKQASNLRDDHLSSEAAEKFKQLWSRRGEIATSLNRLKAERLSNSKEYLENVQSHLDRESAKSAELKSASENLQRFLKESLSPSIYEQHRLLEMKEGQLNSQYALLMESVRENHDKVIPYDEFWADFIGVMILKDPTVYSLLGASQDEARSFARRVDVKDLPSEPQLPTDLEVTATDEFGNTISSTTLRARWSGNQHFDIYLMLGAAKFHLYEHYLSNPLRSQERGRIVGAVYRAIRSEILFRLNHKSDPLTIQEMNRRLIQAIDLEFERDQ